MKSDCDDVGTIGNNMDTSRSMVTVGKTPRKRTLRDKSNNISNVTNEQSSVVDLKLKKRIEDESKNEMSLEEGDEE